YRNITLSGRSNVPFAAVSAGPLPSKEPLHRVIHDGGGTLGGKLRLTVDGLTFEGVYGSGGANNSLLHGLDIAANAKVAHFRNIKLDRLEGSKRELLSVTPVVSARPKEPLDVMPVYLHDYYGPGRHVKAVWAHSKHYVNDGLKYRVEKPLTGSHTGMG